MTTKKKTSQERPVIVTTAHKGVFFGYATKTDGPTIDLRSARMCIYWQSDLRGIVGLATAGPSSGCKIGPAATGAQVRDITAVLECTPEAAAKWEKAPWG